MIKIDWAKLSNACLIKMPTVSKQLSKLVFYGWYYSTTQKQWYRFKNDNHNQPIGLWVTVYKRIYERYPDGEDD